MFYDKYISLCASAGKTPSGVAIELGISKSSVSQWKAGRNNPSDITVQKIANYFNVPMSELTGERQKETPAHNVDERREVSDKDLMFALWGDTAEVSDADLEDVKRYAAFVAERKKKRE